jgi:Protein of unknown function (DUF2511)
MRYAADVSLIFRKEIPREWKRDAVVHSSCSGFCCRADARLHGWFDFANHWPFEVEQARLRCEGKGAVILTVRGTDYAVNGMAASSRYRPIQAVVIDPKIDIGPIISRGLKLCK